MMRSPVIDVMLRSVTHHTAASPSPSNSSGVPGSHVVRRSETRGACPRPRAPACGRRPRRTTDRGWIRRPRRSRIRVDRRRSGAIRRGSPCRRGWRARSDSSSRPRPRRGRARAATPRTRRRRAPGRAMPRPRPSHARGVGRGSVRSGSRAHSSDSTVDTRSWSSGGSRPLERRGEHLEAVAQRLQLAPARGAPAQVPANLQVVGSVQRPQGEVGEERPDVVTRRHVRPPPARRPSTAPRTSGRGAGGGPPGSASSPCRPGSLQVGDLRARLAAQVRELQRGSLFGAVPPSRCARSVRSCVTACSSGPGAWSASRGRSI